MLIVRPWPCDLEWLKPGHRFSQTHIVCTLVPSYHLFLDMVLESLLPLDFVCLQMGCPLIFELPIVSQESPIVSQKIVVPTHGPSTRIPFIELMVIYNSWMVSFLVLGKLSIPFLWKLQTEIKNEYMTSVYLNVLKYVHQPSVGTSSPKHFITHKLIYSFITNLISFCMHASFQSHFPLMSLSLKRIERNKLWCLLAGLLTLLINAEIFLV